MRYGPKQYTEFNNEYQFTFLRHSFSNRYVYDEERQKKKKINNKRMEKDVPQTKYFCNETETQRDDFNNKYQQRLISWHIKPHINFIFIISSSSFLFLIFACHRHKYHITSLRKDLHIQWILIQCQIHKQMKKHTY